MIIAWMCPVCPSAVVLMCCVVFSYRWIESVDRMPCGCDGCCVVWSVIVVSLALHTCAFAWFIGRKNDGRRRWGKNGYVFSSFISWSERDAEKWQEANGLVFFACEFYWLLYSLVYFGKEDNVLHFECEKVLNWLASCFIILSVCMHSSVQCQCFVAIYSHQHHLTAIATLPDNVVDVVFSSTRVCSVFVVCCWCGLGLIFYWRFARFVAKGSLMHLLASACFW